MTSKIAFAFPNNLQRRLEFLMIVAGDLTVAEVLAASRGGSYFNGLTVKDYTYGDQSGSFVYSDAFGNRAIGSWAFGDQGWVSLDFSNYLNSYGGNLHSLASHLGTVAKSFGAQSAHYLGQDCGLSPFPPR